MDTPRDGSATPAPNTTTTKQPSMIYICGDCHQENEITPKVPIRCRECGYRIVYKKRTKRAVVLDGR
ncbi:hypothetical protein HELRODRAFT_154955 [Helobdella robusta]|uniref:DNA-directed RNA polymerases I, II, and III subunit RPABC4 n=1 Tax=Helobdella robusta TaxID=6412 RepID=T1ELG6_HELRO|nr:hypothetical protein HELRODRAFT_154955 [Helobdella robusta]ESO00709.1 hypothetical protein HELRODRAFT_154955 [Helobdella robusta]